MFRRGAGAATHSGQPRHALSGAAAHAKLALRAPAGQSSQDVPIPRLQAFWRPSQDFEVNVIICVNRAGSERAR